MCEEINKIYARISEYEYETEQDLRRLWAEVGAIKDKLKKVQEVWKDE